jgi:hypothetical protein
MSKKTTTPAAAEAIRYDAFTVRGYEAGGEQKSEWLKIGVAFPHKDGDGLRIQLAAVPVDGCVVLRKHKPATE